MHHTAHLYDWVHICCIVLALLVVSNAWLLYRVLRPLQRLAAQTTDLASGELAAFQQYCGGIREIGILQRSLASMAGHVRRAQAEDRAYHHALSIGQEAERARLAHELHDDAVQSLIAITQSLDLASTWLASDAPRAVTMLKLARTQVVDSVEGLRRLIANLRPPALEELGLVPALQMLAASESGVQVTVTVTGKTRRLDAAYELALFRAAQEALRNAERHGQAHQITLNINYQSDAVHLTITDDGIGFQVPVSLACLAGEGHYGLPGMKERVAYLNGTMEIHSQSGVGTEVAISLPLAAPDQPTTAVHDPVCGAVVEPEQAYGSTDYEGERYYFCCPVCQGAFQRNPGMYLADPVLRL